MMNNSKTSAAATAGYKLTAKNGNPPKSGQKTAKRTKQKNVIVVAKRTQPQVVSNAKMLPTKPLLDVTAMVKRQVTAILDEKGLSKSFVTDPAYSDLYNQAHCPPAWPKPLPVYTGTQGAHRYAYTQFTTGKMIHVVPAGQTRVLLAPFWHNSHPLICLGHSDGVAARNWDVKSCIEDSSGTAYAATAAPIIRHGNSYLEDADSHISTDTYTRPDLTSKTPLLSQLIGGTMKVEIAGPYDSQFTVGTMCEGDQPKHMGRKTEVHEFDTASNATWSAGLPAGLRGRFNTIYGITSNLSLVSAIQQLGNVSLHTGSSPGALVHMSIPLTPESGWQFNAELENAISGAEDGNATSVANNIRPRQNFPYLMQYGAVLVNNTGSVPVTFIATLQVTQAHILNQDDSVRGVPPLVSELRQSAPPLVFQPGSLNGDGVPAQSLRGNGQSDHTRTFATTLLSRMPANAASQHAVVAQQNLSGTPTISMTSKPDRISAALNAVSQVASVVRSGIDLVTRVSSRVEDRAYGETFGPRLNASSAATAAAGGGYRTFG